MENEVNLENAELFCDSSSGIYIPQRFAREVDRGLVSEVSQRDWLILDFGPDHEEYWEAWEEVLNNALITHPEHGRMRLYQDGDLWVVPECDL